ncbi:hypothetical protein BRADI_3g25637v3 [Brachypodium distachyon]|uniref:Uncharacterized protein n=1 Tax=Brachypodium distachyon TaxID=15368 RepID=A0A2K2CZ87_BRADI|nr:hypothetical protein BRADI_3g25637v3 [Brachypodium distachyon]
MIKVPANGRCGGGDGGRGEHNSRRQEFGKTHLWLERCPYPPQSPPYRGLHPSGLRSLEVASPSIHHKNLYAHGATGRWMLHVISTLASSSRVIKELNQWMFKILQ